MKYHQILLDDDSINLAFQKQMLPSQSDEDLFVSVLTYLSELADQVRADRYVAALGGIPHEVDSDEDEVDLTRRQLAAERLQDLKRTAYAKNGEGWESIAVDKISSASIVATLAAEAEEQRSCLIVTSDKRLLAHLADHVDVLLQGAGDAGARLWSVASFRAQYGIAPELYPIFRALTSQDRRDVVPYTSPSGASELLQNYPNLLELVNYYLCRSLILDESLRSSMPRLAKHLKDQISDSVVRTIPKILNLYQVMNTKIKINENEK